MERTREELPLSEEQKMFDIKQPHHNDVLCGRGVTTNRHPGNESFRALVGVNKEVYVSSTKKQKMAISRSIVEAVRSLAPPGRFLEKNPRTGLWSDIGHKKAVEKTSQALRDGAASLRKQLSADLGDPDFLNAVFDIDVDEKDKNNNQDVSNEAKKGKSTDKITMKGKENNKLKGMDKTRAFKSRTTVVKKGHRRVHSNPSVATRSHLKGKNLRGEYETEPPLANFSSAHAGALPMSPCLTPVRQQISYPSTPKTWSGRPTHSERFNLDGLYHPHSRHDAYYYQEMHPRESEEQLYRHPDTPKRWSDQWAPPENRPSRQPQLVKYPLSAPAACHSWSSSDTYHHPPPLPHRHHFSPSGYRSHPHPAEWAPRMIPRRSEYLHSPHRHSYNHASYHPMTQNEWRRSPSAQNPNAPTREYDLPTTKEVSSSGLAVPALGGETNDAMPTRVLLAPRSRRQIGNHSTRPPKYQPSDFAPPPSAPRLSRDAACADRETVQNLHIRREPKRSGLARAFRKTEASPVGEEKKIDDSKSKLADPSIPNQEDIFLPLAFSLKPRHCSPYPQDDEDELKSIHSPKLEPLETADKQATEDIPMSPVRENPKTLMEVPENILTLPISPFGPNDDPG